MINFFQMIIDGATDRFLTIDGPSDRSQKTIENRSQKKIKNAFRAYKLRTLIRHRIEERKRRRMLLCIMTGQESIEKLMHPDRLHSILSDEDKHAWGIRVY